MFNRKRILVAGCVVICLLIAGGIWWRANHRVELVYSPTGYGGYVPAPSKKSDKKPDDPLIPAAEAYSAGKYKEAESEAQRVIKSASKSSDPEQRKKAVQAQNILAFSAARQENMEIARERFAVLREEAAKLPDKGQQKAPPGQVSPTLEEEGAHIRKLWEGASINIAGASTCCESVTRPIDNTWALKSAP